MTFQSSSLAANTNNGIPSIDSPSYSSPRRRSPSQAAYLHSMSPGAPPITLLGLDSLVRMEDVVASRLATRMALARLGLGAVGQQQQQQQEAVTLLALQQQQQVHCISPVKQSRGLLNQFARQQQAAKLLAMQQQQQQQQQPPRVPCVSPVKQSRAPCSSPGVSSLPGLDLLSTASLSVASSASSPRAALSPEVSTVSLSSSPTMPASPELNATACNELESKQEITNGRIYIETICTNDILVSTVLSLNHTFYILSIKIFV